MHQMTIAYIIDLGTRLEKDRRNHMAHLRHEFGHHVSLGDNYACKSCIYQNNFTKRQY